MANNPENQTIEAIEGILGTIKADGLRWAEIIDAYRIFPRIIVGVYGWLVYDMYQWYTALEAPTANQAAFVSTIVGAAAIIVGVYVNTGRKWDK